MDSLITVDSPKPEKRKLKMRFKFLICAVIYFLVIFACTRLYNYINTKFFNTDNNTDSTVSETSDNTPKTYYINNIKSSYQNKKMALINSKIPPQLSEEQYNNILNIYHNTSEKTVYLTFDDGPSENITPLILDLLNQEKIKATFFVLGTNVDRYPALVQREYSEGHFIANHGYSHKYSEIYESAETVLNDYKQCEQSVKRALNDENFTSKVYRYPGGSNGGKYHDIKNAGKELLKENHVAYLDWNALTRDAEGTPTHESILESLHETVGEKNVVVLLMHDSSSKILTYEALPEVITFFRDNGYNFKTLYDVL